MSLVARRVAELIEPETFDAMLDRIHDEHDGDGTAARLAMLEALKSLIAESRERIDAWLVDDGRGLQCAETLSGLQNELICGLHRYATRRLYAAVNPSQSERMSVVAVGGYGRGTLAPGSDIDLLFLLPYKQTPWGESVVEFLLYMLWDLGFKVGHATRTVRDCIRASLEDMTIRTALLDARPLCGDAELYDEFKTAFARDVVRGSSGEFIDAKLAERDSRHRRGGESRYLVEPNVKEGKGGQRDLQTLFWIAKYHYGIESWQGLFNAGVISRDELKLFRRCEDFLWSVRCHLHFLTGRAEERLSFDLQAQMAARLGYTPHPGQREVERFMKHYFLIAKDVGDLTRILCAGLENQHAKKPPMLSRFFNRLGRRGTRAVAGNPDFLNDADRLSIADDQVFERDPVNLIRLFHLADQSNLVFHPDALKLASRSLKLIDRKMREDPEANRLFLEILTSKRDPEVVLRRMNECGVLGKFIPDFGRIVALVQFNMYHHFTVDEHLIRSVGVLADIEAGRHAKEHPLSHEIIQTIDNRAALYVAMLLHDIAKGRPEDHSIAGARIARRLCPRLGLSRAETETVAWLVENHLVMSMIAQSRDLGDPRTVADFAALVQSPERLKLLLLLTVADIRAVGPGVWNGWKGQLLRTLYYETEPVLSGGHSQLLRPDRIAEAQAETRGALDDWGDREFAAYRKRHYPAYWLKTEPARRLRHARFLREAREGKRSLATDIQTDAFKGITELTVLAPDHPRLLSIIAGACAAAGANIMDAQIFTTTDGYALDTVFIGREFEQADDERRRAKRIAETVEKALLGETWLSEAVGERRTPRKIKAFSIEPEVFVNNSLSDRFTVIEVSGLDRPGLLYDLTMTISRLNLNIGSAHIATFGERAVDVFYVTDLTGQKITNASRQASIRRHLAANFDQG
ncbi:MAG: [protein-PII] uridylyltransferase [Flavobacteriaceae bacterium]